MRLCTDELVENVRILNRGLRITLMRLCTDELVVYVLHDSIAHQFCVPNLTMTKNGNVAY